MEIRNYTAGDEKAILELFELVFGKAMTAEYWNWRFKRNPTGKYMIKLMWDGESLVGHYAVSPVMLESRNREILTGLSMTTMTHPRYVGLGIFQQLSESLYSEIQKEYGVVVVWGFPNNNSHRGFIKNLGWKDITVLPMLSCQTAALTSRENNGIVSIDSFTHHEAAAYSSCNAKYEVKVKKDESYLNWRYVENPANNYRILRLNGDEDGFVVCKEYQAGEKKQVDIMEWCVPDNEKLTRSVILHLAHLFPADQYQQFNIWMPLRDERHLYLEKLGFVNSSPVTYWSIRSFAGEEIAIENDWWIQLGDSDVY